MAFALSCAELKLFASISGTPQSPDTLGAIIVETYQVEIKSIIMNEQSYRENKITETLWSMSGNFSELSFMWEYATEEQKSEESYMEKEIELKDNFEYKTKTIYKLVVTYLETSNLKEYLTDFKTEFATLFTSGNLFDQGFDNDSGHTYSETITKFWHFLSPFEFSQQSYIDKLLKQTGVTHLERILRNTQVIINETNTKPTSEPQVYKAVKFVVKSVFPSALEPTSGFFKSFKNYNPDILVPEIHTAVEYKYADTEAKLKNQIDQVIADTKGYTGDTNYEIFYAVFYVTDDFWGIDKFETVWKEMEFPKNWKGIYIIGKK